MDSACDQTKTPWPRKGMRVAVEAEISLRRPSERDFRVRVFDISQQGCRLEFVTRPQLEDRVWIKFEGMQALEAAVCWCEGFVAGVEFDKPIHPAVFDHLLGKLG